MRFPHCGKSSLAGRSNLAISRENRQSATSKSASDATQNTNPKRKRGKPKHQPAFYGAPGVGRARPTKLFLVGKNFSVHETQVIAGNVKCCFEMLSREVMKVTIPTNVRTVVCHRQPRPGEDPCAECRPTGECGPGCYKAVEVRLATPYGVSGRLLIPVIPGEKTAAEAAAAATTKATVAIAKKVVAGHSAVFHPYTYGWAPEKAKGCVCYNAGQDLARFCLYNDAVLVKREGRTPFTAPKQVIFGGWVEAVHEDGSTAKFSKEIGPITLKFNNGTAQIGTHECAPANGGNPKSLVHQLWRVLSVQPGLARQAVALNIHGYVRPAGCDDCEKPIRLVNTLTIVLETCQSDACATDACLPGACPTCNAKTSATTTEKPMLTTSAPPSFSSADTGILQPPPTAMTARGRLERAPLKTPNAISTPSPGPVLSPPSNVLPVQVPTTTASPPLAPPAPPATVVPVRPVPGSGVPGRVVLPARPSTLTIRTTAPPTVPPPAPAPSRDKHQLFDFFHLGDQ